MNHPTTMGDPRGPPIFYGKPLRVRNKEKISRIGEKIMTENNKNQPRAWIYARVPDNLPETQASFNACCQQAARDGCCIAGGGMDLTCTHVSLGLRMSAFNVPSIADICADDTIDLRELGSEKKVALFVVTPDTTTAYNFLAAVMFQQCFQVLVDMADHRPDHRLPRHLRFLLDEFPNIGMIPDFQILISTIRSRDIACTLIYQSLSQLKSQYKDDWATIYENCDSLIVLGAGSNPENLEFFSKALGKATIEVMNTSENKGGQGSYTKSYQALGRELMTPEELRTMPRNLCLLMISGVAPFYSRKYDLQKHPNYPLVQAQDNQPFDYEKRAKMRFADFIRNVKDVKTIDLCAENNNTETGEIQNGNGSCNYETDL